MASKLSSIARSSQLCSPVKMALAMLTFRTRPMHTASLIGQENMKQQKANVSHTNQQFVDLIDIPGPQIPRIEPPDLHLARLGMLFRLLSELYIVL